MNFANMVKDVHMDGIEMAIAVGEVESRELYQYLKGTIS